jgi:hypothetical protein
LTSPRVRTAASARRRAARAFPARRCFGQKRWIIYVNEILAPAALASRHLAAASDAALALWPVATNGPVARWVAVRPWRSWCDILGLTRSRASKQTCHDQGRAASTADGRIPCGRRQRQEANEQNIFHCVHETNLYDAASGKRESGRQVNRHWEVCRHGKQDQS